MLRVKLFVAHTAPEHLLALVLQQDVLVQTVLALEILQTAVALKRLHARVRTQMCLKKRSRCE
jgi:hypothetical protein